MRELPGDRGWRRRSPAGRGVLTTDYRIVHQPRALARHHIWRGASRQLGIGGVRVLRLPAGLAVLEERRSRRSLRRSGARMLVPDRPSRQTSVPVQPDAELGMPSIC